MTRRAVSLVLFALLASVIPLSSLEAAGGGQNDAGRGQDAGDTRATALALPSPQTARHRGQLVAGTDTQDWYSFDVPSVFAGNGRWRIDVLLATDPPNQFALELWGPLAADTAPKATGGGSNGAVALSWSGDDDGEWKIRVSGTATGSYDLVLLVRPENDHGQTIPIDAPDHASEPTNGLDVGAIPATTGRRVQGNLTPGDPGDLYHFPVSNGQQILATLSFPRGADLRVVLIPANTAVGEGSRSGEGMHSAVATAPQVLGAGEWGARVTRVGNSLATGSSYVLNIRTGIEATNSVNDGGTAGDAAPMPEHPTPPARTLPRGLTTGAFDTDSGDEEDSFKLVGVQAGQIIRIGGASYLTDASINRPFILLDLYDPAGGFAKEINPCGGAAQFAFTATLSGDWRLRVREAKFEDSSQPCGMLVGDRTSRYALVYDLQNQFENGTKDAVAGIVSAEPLSDPVMSLGWTDRSDKIDTYKLGSVPKDGVIRAGIMALNPSLDFRLRILDAAGSMVGAQISSSAGAARINVVAAATGMHYLQVEQHSPGGAALFNDGLYRVYARSNPNEAPAPVTLNTPPDGDIGRTSVRVSWSLNSDSDFQSYEVHRSKDIGFTPGTSTVGSNITTQTTTSVTLTGLDAGATYEILVRVVDDSNLKSDSNRIVVDLDSGPLNNRAPTLASHDVDPDSGAPSQTFTYKIVYTDQDGDPPTIRRVYVDGVPHDMSGANTNYANGVQFTYATTLAAGSHNYYFQFSDGEFEARDPLVQGQYDGPTVQQPGNRPPTVTAHASPDEGNAPLNVQFDAEASDQDGDPLTYSWDFNVADGIQQDSTAESPSHTYNQPGDYTARVEVRDPDGAIATSNVDVHVSAPSNRPPTVAPTADPDEGNAPLTVQFEANALDSDGHIVSYAWDFDSADGVTGESSEENPDHTYASAGTYVATVTVRDNGSATASGTVTVTVSTSNNAPPTITISASPMQGSAPLSVHFVATTSDPNSDTVTVTWDFDDSDGVDVDASGKTADHTFDEPRTFLVTAVAKDTSGATAADTVEIEVGPEGSPPPGGSDVTIIAEPESGKAPLTVEFSADTSEMESEPDSYLWDFGDDTAESGAPSPTHTFQKSGKYVVTLIVTDAQGNEHEATILIDVKGKGSPGVGPMLVALSIVGVVVLLRRRAGPDA